MNELRCLVRLILEAAVVSQAAAGQNLALYRRKNGENAQYILYDPAALATEMPKYEDAGGDLDKVIYGYLEVKPHHGDSWGAGEVKFAAARKGYGPLMYELAMSDFESGLFPDRISTSDAARNVWKRYAQRPDVEKKPFDDKEHPKTAPKIDDAKMIPDFDGEEAYLNQAYKGSGDPAGKPGLMANHRDALATFADQGTPPAQLEQTLRSMADEYFGTRYRNS